MIKLVPVDPESGSHIDILYELLKEREPHQSISHKEMPTFSQHMDFVQSNPYKAWELVWVQNENGGTCVGAIYLTHHNEVGLAIFGGYQRMGFGSAALEMFHVKHKPPRLLANVNPHNRDGREFWEKMGGKLIQVTYEL